MDTGADSRTGRIIALTGEYRCKQCSHRVQLVEGDFAPPCRGRSHKEEHGPRPGRPVIPGATAWALEWGSTVDWRASNSFSRTASWNGRRPSTWIPNDNRTSIQRLLESRDLTGFH